MRGLSLDSPIKAYKIFSLSLKSIKSVARKKKKKNPFFVSSTRKINNINNVGGRII